MRLLKKTEDITGKSFSKLTVLKFIGYQKEGRSERRRSYWLCSCVCGNTTVLSQTTLISGNTKSCGCLGKENIKVLQRNRTKEKSYAGTTAVLNKYKQSAKNRKLEFLLTREQFKEITSQNCHYCDSIPKNISTINSKRMTVEGVANAVYIYNGIDRKDNNKGYTLENCVPCCKICNFLKKDTSYEDFLAHLIKIVTNIGKNNV